MLASYISPSNRRFASALNSCVLTYPSMPFTPLSLFSGGVQGVWYDPSDLTTMFEDSAGTTAVHTPGNGTADSPVGLLLDKHSNGVGSNGAAKYNTFTYTEQFDNAAWSKTEITVSSNAAISPDGTTTADKVIPSTNNLTHYVTQSSNNTANAASTLSVYAKAAEYNSIAVQHQHWPTSNAYGGVRVNLSDGSIINYFNTASTGCTVSNAGNGWYKIVIEFTPPSSNGTAVFIARDSSISSSTDAFAGNGTSGIYIWGADFRLTSQAALTPTYQPITSSWVATIAGNHATQSTSTKRPTLSALYNILQRTEQFDHAYWNKDSVTVVANAAVAPDGTTTADNVYPSSSGTARYIWKTVSGQITGTTFKTKVSLKSNGIGFAYIYNARGNTLFWINLATGDTSNVGTNITNITSTRNSTTGWVDVSFESVLTDGITNAAIFIGPSDASGSTSVTTNGTDGIYIWGADLRVSNDGVGLPAYQRVVDANTYDSVGFPYYLNFDGVDDCLATGSVNFTANDKVTFNSALRKTLGDSSIALYSEFSADAAGNNGAWYVAAPVNTDKYKTVSRGTAVSQRSTGLSSYSSPISNVLTFLGDISAPNHVLRLNGTQIAQTSETQGTGNFGTYPIFVGSRNNSLYYFGGRSYGIIISNAASTAAQISNTETWLNGKAKIY